MVAYRFTNGLRLQTMRNCVMTALAIAAISNAAYAQQTSATTIHYCAPRPVLADVYLAPYSQLNNSIAQVRLQQAGYYKGPIDGQFGRQTKQALQGFQVNEGLDPADGIEWPTTVQSLGNSNVSAGRCVTDGRNR